MRSGSGGKVYYFIWFTFYCLKLLGLLKKMYSYGINLPISKDMLIVKKWNFGQYIFYVSSVGTNTKHKSAPKVVVPCCSA